MRNVLWRSLALATAMLAGMAVATLDVKATDPDVCHDQMCFVVAGGEWSHECRYADNWNCEGTPTEMSECMWSEICHEP